MRNTKKENKNGRKVIFGAMIAFVAVVLTTVLCVTSYEDSGHKVTTSPVETTAVSPEPEPSITTDKVAEGIYVTNGETDVRTEPGGGTIMGTLQGGISITVTSSTEDGWGYIREFKGWVKLTNLKHTAIDNVVGLAFTIGDMQNYYYSEPDLTSEITGIDGYNSYEILPYIYNDNFYRIGENAYIEKSHVLIDYYDKDYYNHVVKLPISRGYVQRHTPEIERNISLDLTQPSGLTIDELHQITLGTELEGIAPSLKRIEDNNGVNALFALSVAQLESGNGSSYLARNQNNLFGLDANNGGMTFSTKGDCIEYFGELIQEDYFGAGRQDLYSIGERYCESSSWPDKVGSLMRRNLNSINY